MMPIVVRRIYTKHLYLINKERMESQTTALP